MKPPISRSHVRVLELVTVGLDGEPDEIVRAGRAVFRGERDPWVVAQAIRNVGHLARRYGIVDWPLLRSAEAAAGRHAQGYLLGAVEDALDDIAIAIPHRRYLDRLAAERSLPL